MIRRIRRTARTVPTSLVQGRHRSVSMMKVINKYIVRLFKRFVFDDIESTWTFMAAPTTRPTLCATKLMSKHADKNIENLNHSSGCEVSRYTITTYIMQNIA